MMSLHNGFVYRSERKESNDSFVEAVMQKRESKDLGNQRKSSKDGTHQRKTSKGIDSIKGADSPRSFEFPTTAESPREADPLGGKGPQNGICSTSLFESPKGSSVGDPKVINVKKFEGVTKKAAEESFKEQRMMLNGRKSSSDSVFGNEHGNEQSASYLNMKVRISHALKDIQRLTAYPS